MLLSLLLLACLPKASIVSAPSPMSVAVVAALEPLEDATVRPMPAEIDRRLAGLLAARNLSAETLGQDDWEGAFTKGRTTRFRVAHAAMASDADLVLVVEAFARYGSQLNGRYRWTVQVSASLAPGDKPEDAVTSEFAVPVFLQFSHEQEAEAVVAAATVIERQLGHLLDQVLGGL
jgi:fructose-specific component phosphotransferase system IIB-like protein